MNRTLLAACIVATARCNPAFAVLVGTELRAEALRSPDLAEEIVELLVRIESGPDARGVPFLATVSPSSAPGPAG